MCRGGLESSAASVSGGSQRAERARCCHAKVYFSHPSHSREHGGVSLSHPHPFQQQEDLPKWCPVSSPNAMSAHPHYPNCLIMRRRQVSSICPAPMVMSCSLPNIDDALSLLARMQEIVQLMRADRPVCFPAAGQESANGAFREEKIDIPGEKGRGSPFECRCAWRPGGSDGFQPPFPSQLQTPPSPVRHCRSSAELETPTDHHCLPRLWF